MLLKKNRHELRTLLAYRCPDELLHGTTDLDIAFRNKLTNELKEVDFLIEKLKQFRDGTHPRNVNPKRLTNDGAKD